MANRSPDRRFSRATQALLVFAGIIVVLLLAIRFVASPVAERMVNRKLAELPNYTGKVGALQLAIWRGAVDVQDFAMTARGKENEPPLVRVKKATVVFSWSALFRGKAGGH